MRTNQPHVLVVEDEPAQREVLFYNLEAEGFRVTTAGNGEDGLMMVQEDPPDVMVLDWMLPSVSGIEVCRQLKARAETRDIPIIMLSARSEEVDKVRGLETGADDYVVKPYSCPSYWRGCGRSCGGCGHRPLVRCWSSRISRWIPRPTG